MNTLEARYGVDTPLTVWVRKDDAKVDFTDETITVAAFAYGSTMPIDTLEAASPEVGKVTFTVSKEATERTLSPALYRLSVRASDQEYWAGLLRIV